MILFKKEKEVVELIIRHLDKVEECLSMASKTLMFYLNGEIKKAKGLARQVDSIETEADEIRHIIRDKLYSGAYLPVLREDIHNLIEGVDRVANAGEACCDFFLDQRPKIPEELKSFFVIAVQESMGIITPLKQAVLCFLKGECSIDVVRHDSKQVGLKESDVDKIEWDLTKQIFISSSLDYAHKIHLKLCLDTIVEVSDRAEDAVNQLELTTLKSVF